MPLMTFALTRTHLVPSSGREAPKSEFVSLLLKDCDVGFGETMEQGSGLRLWSIVRSEPTIT